MKVFTCQDHDYHYPVGVASVVIAPNVEEARKALDKQLLKRGLRGYEGKSYTLNEMNTKRTDALVMCCGDY
jgi:hypothetical protein